MKVHHIIKKSVLCFSLLALISVLSCEVTEVVQCRETSKRCDEQGVPQQCVNGHWENFDTSGIDYTCKNGQYTKGECTEESTQCVASTSGESVQYKTCSGNKWSEPNNCKFGAICEEIGGVAQCREKNVPMVLFDVPRTGKKKCVTENCGVLLRAVEMVFIAMALPASKMSVLKAQPSA